MAEQLKDGSGDNLDSRLAALGISPLVDTEMTEVVREEAESETEVETESDESPDKETDASEETEAELESSSESSEEDGEEQDGGDDSPQLESLQAEVEKLTADSRAWQSRYDQESAKNSQFHEQMQKFWTELQTLKNQQANESVSIPDDDLVDGRTVKALLQAQNDPVQPEPSPSQPRTHSKEVQATWLNSRSDLTEVSKYISDNGLQSDPTINGLPTDQVGYYNAVKVRMLEGQMKAMEKSHKAEVEKALAGQKKKLSKKAKVPPTGGEGAGAGRGGSEPVSQFENEVMAWGKKFGLTVGQQG